MMASPFRTVLIGLGNIGTRYSHDARTARYFQYATHAQVLAVHPAFTWVAGVDTNPAAVAAAHQDWTIPLFTSQLADLLPLQPEVAVLATPPTFRLPVLDALPSLRAIIVEKPLGLSLASSEQFIHECLKRNIAVQVNYWRRADNLLQSLARGGLTDRIAQPQALFGIYGNGLRNNGSHLIDLARLLFGEIVRAQALGPPFQRRQAPIAGDPDIRFSVEFSSGLLGFFHTVNFDHYREIALDIWGTAGRILLAQEGLTTAHFPVHPHRALENDHELAHDTQTALGCTAGQALLHLYDNLAAHLCSGVPLCSPGNSALVTQTVVEAILESSGAHGTPIQLANVPVNPPPASVVLARS